MNIALAIFSVAQGTWFIEIMGLEKFRNPSFQKIFSQPLKFWMIWKSNWHHMSNQPLCNIRSLGRWAPVGWLIANQDNISCWREQCGYWRLPLGGLTFHESQEVQDMSLKVIYSDGTSGTINLSFLTDLIKSGNIVAFQCSGRWIETRRKQKIDTYKGPERRKTVCPI